MAGYQPAFDAIRPAEVARVNAWRRAQGGEQAPLLSATDLDQPAGNGLAISGGGIRSAAFALGALQAIDAGLPPDGNRPGGIGRIDYLSTVSGGGYIGTSMIAAMNENGGRFPFASTKTDKSDPPTLGHIRNHSRYLIPGGLPDLIADLLVVLRGLALNLVFTLGLVLAFAGLTRSFNPTTASLDRPDLFGWQGFATLFPFRLLSPFPLGIGLALLLLACLLAWPLLRWFGRAQSETGGDWSHWLSSLFLLSLTALFIEAQPWAILKLQDAVPRVSRPSSGLTSWLTTTAIPALAALFALFGARIERLIAFADRRPGKKAALGGLLLKLGFVVAALVLPLLIWLSYLFVSIWIGQDWSPRPDAIASGLGWLADLLAQGARWMAARAFPLAAFLTGLALLVLIWAIWAFAPNATSLHRLYRERLTKAFLFRQPAADTPHAAFEDLEPIKRLAFSDLNPAHGPLHLINTALNLQGSQRRNRRGRNADFFFFSSAWSGSDATGFVATSGDSTFPLPDFATAMAVSGAAASSNMGSQSMRGMAPTLALLNIRLGYWQRNPVTLRAPSADPRSLGGRLRDRLKLYLLTEVFSAPDETAGDIYLTDGGHIENLGLYELLRRRCRTILVLDAESDPEMTFSSLATAQRYARIDHGVRIELPWRAIALSHRATIEADGADPVDPEDRCHVAVGRIEYPGGGEGRIVYLKASLTGDENDYVRDYKRRNPAFPQETTGDQFFSEDQFEAYRALGFHALHGALTGRGAVAGLDVDSSPGKGGDPENSARARAFCQQFE